MSELNVGKSKNQTTYQVIPKHLYDVNRLFPTGVGKSSIKHGPDANLPKETKDWLQKVAFKF